MHGAPILGRRAKPRRYVFGQRSRMDERYDLQRTARDDRYVMFSTNQGADAKLYDLQKDPGMHNDIAGIEPNMVKRMFEDYILRDAGGPLPTYDYGTAAG